MRTIISLENFRISQTKNTRGIRPLGSTKANSKGKFFFLSLKSYKIHALFLAYSCVTSENQSLLT